MSVVEKKIEEHKRFCSVVELKDKVPKFKREVIPPLPKKVLRALPAETADGDKVRQFRKEYNRGVEKIKFLQVKMYEAQKEIFFLNNGIEQALCQVILILNRAGFNSFVCGKRVEISKEGKPFDPDEQRQAEILEKIRNREYAIRNKERQIRNHKLDIMEKTALVEFLEGEKDQLKGDINSLKFDFYNCGELSPANDL